MCLGARVISPLHTPLHSSLLLCHFHLKFEYHTPGTVRLPLEEGIEMKIYNDTPPTNPPPTPLLTTLISEIWQSEIHGISFDVNPEEPFRLQSNFILKDPSHNLYKVEVSVTITNRTPKSRSKTPLTRLIKAMISA